MKWFCALLAAGLMLHSTACQAGDVAKVLEVSKAVITKIPVPPGRNVLVIGAAGYVSDTGWENGRLIPYVYVTPPEDGIWDFDFVAERKDGMHLQVVTPIFAAVTYPRPPRWVKGVRIHASANTVVALLSGGAKANGDLALEDPTVAESGSISFDLHYEQNGGRHCVVGTVDVDIDTPVGGVNEEIEIGRICINANQDCVSGTKGLGSFGGIDAELEWELCKEGNELCLKGRVCLDPPIGGNICSSRVERCVEIE